MVKQKRLWAAIVFLCCLPILNACSGSGSKQALSTRSQRFSEIDPVATVWRPTLTHDIPTTLNPAVERWVSLFQSRFKPNFDRWMTRLGAYGPTIEKILREEGVPRDLIYLAMIESGFNLNASSVASAVGPWQFISSTGRMYGLHNDFFMDDRRDLVRSTRAAARHLKDLYKTYGDWYLAFAAYNAGPGTVNRAVRGTGSNDYWRLCQSRYLRQETKDYVPKILAALHIVKNYRRFGYSTEIFGEPMQADRVTVTDATDIGVIARSSGTDVETIRNLNPHIVSGITRPGESIGVFIPKGQRSAFMQNYSVLPADERVSGLFHRAGWGETIASVSKRYGLNKQRVARLNNMGTDQKLSTGQSIRLPADRRILTTMLTNSYRSTRSTASGSWTTHSVRRGETLSRIASRYRTSTRQLMTWNRLGGKAFLRVGQRLRVYQAGSRTAVASGGLYFSATGGPQFASHSRMSGVSHIIANDQTAPITAGKSEVTRRDAQAAPDFVTERVAVNTYSESIPENDDGPAVVRTIEDVIDDQGTNTSTPSAMDRNLQTANLVAQPVSRYVTPVASNRPMQIHVVRSGETLSSISKRYRISLAVLRSQNGLIGDKIRANQKLKVGSTQNNSATASVYRPDRTGLKPVQVEPLRPQAASPRLASNAPASIVHNIRSGDTLWTISKRYGVKIADIKKWNSLRGDSLRPNQKLKIYRGNKPYSARL